MEWENVLLSCEDGIATITLNRPEKYNAFAGRMREDILEALEIAGADDSVRVLVVTGAGTAFCAGGDVGEFLQGQSKALDQANTASSQRLTMAKVVIKINQLEKPVIAAVNGVAAGGGCNLALACDMRIASEKARFAQVFTRRGAHPDWGGIYFLPRLVGYAKAAELIFSGRIVEADEALRLGMVNQVVPVQDFKTTVAGTARQIAANAPLPIAFAKRGLQRFPHMNLYEALDYEAYVLRVTMESYDFKEGFTAFLEKRTPQFKGC
jgi:2-(1,2-epoxy-1,2-dihydrophenyl)acetyl-CoA isomerase